MKITKQQLTKMIRESLDETGSAEIYRLDLTRISELMEEIVSLVLDQLHEARLDGSDISDIDGYATIVSDELNNRIYNELVSNFDLRY